jgi:hypothetical protein
MSRTQTSVIDVSGALSVDGVLAVHNLGGYVPLDGDEFTIATFGAMGEGSAFRSIAWDDTSYAVSLAYGPNDIKLHITAVPEPSTLFLSALGLIAVGVSVRHNREKLS